LRHIFTRWGQPHALRVDNGPPWGDKQHLPTPLTLWLWGLDIEVIHNRPYRPEDNSKVERCHGVVKQWIEPQTCANFQQLQQQLERVATLQRTAYPSCPHQQTREQAYPQLAHGASPYELQQEANVWQFSLVMRKLSAYRWTRKVSSTGQISLYNRNYAVGRAYAGQLVSVRFAPSMLQWQVEDRDGQLIRCPPCRGLDAEAIRTLKMTYRKPSRTPSQRA